jgi:predicted phosphodiesterase
MGSEGLTPEIVVNALRETGSARAASRALGVAPTTLKDYILRHDIDRAGICNEVQDNVVVDGRSVIVNGKVDYGNIKLLLLDDGLSIHDWVLSRVRVNRWGDQRQLRVDLEPRRDFLSPARADGWKPPKDAKSNRVTDGLVFLLPDQHFPNNDVDLCAAAVRMVKDLKPEQIVFLGDLLDYSAISRHRKGDREPSIQETVDSAYYFLRDLRAASPGSQMTLLEGNHEDRLPNALKDKGLAPLVSVRRGGTEEANVWSSEHVLRLDELGIEQEFPPENCSYEHAEVRVFDNLAARHGHIAKKGSGASGLAMLEKLRRNIIFGHTHRQSITFHTHWDINKQPHRLVAVEAGTMAYLDETGMGYNSCPDWQQGFAVAQVSGDSFVVDLATWVNGCLRWRDYEYRV